MTLITDYHAKYFSHELTRQGRGIDRIGQALFNASVDLNPHQIEAAMFALQSPLSQGVLLADEVGLGKTIEAGLVICQYWAERKRKILVISPASLRKQWSIELREKFNLPNIVLDHKTFRESQRAGKGNPFEDAQVIIASIHFVASKADQVGRIPWDLVVIDEAHKLRNAYRPGNKLGQAIRTCTEGCKKLLLTATPLQNSLLEIYGLSTLIDERIFGEVAFFRSQYANAGGDLEELRQRLSYFCRRTLRKDVVEFIKYTKRIPVTCPFKPTEQEHAIYEAISHYLQREDTYAIPRRQRHLLVLIVRKVLASSPKALIGTLEKVLERLLQIKEQAQKKKTFSEILLETQEIDSDLIDEILEDEEDSLEDFDGEEEQENESEIEINLKKLQEEINLLNGFIQDVKELGTDTKTSALLTALKLGFEHLEKLHAERKVVVFTESRRTQAWLKEFLETNGYQGQVLTFNGTNTDDRSGQIYQEWLEENRNTGRSSGSRAIDLRTAIIDKFQNDASILIATEAGAEGLNLQFCSAMINFDLPWNPQRIEQRIGRCHRYGQKHDVVVINFLNERNDADRRVHEILQQKFNLFSGVFGASDEVLGSIESGIDFEKRILQIYQTCRTQEAIEEAFAALQKDLDEQIQTRMLDTRQMLLENFDEDVHARLKTNLDETQTALDRMTRLFWAITNYALQEKAHFDQQKLVFELIESPDPNIKTGLYNLISKTHENIPGEFLYRLNHPLGEYVLAQSQNAPCPVAEIHFDISNHPTRISLVENLNGKSGWLYLQKLTVQSFESETYLLFTAMDDSGKSLDQETCEKLFNCNGSVVNRVIDLPEEIQSKLKIDAEFHVSSTLVKNMEENNKHFNIARTQLDKWADDQEKAAQKELDDIKRRLRDKQYEANKATSLEEQEDIQKEILRLEKRKKEARSHIFDIEDEITVKRDMLVKQLKERLKQRTEILPLFTIRWRVV